MLNDGIHEYIYDAESRIAQVDNGAITYTYDMGGQRVRKDVGTSFTEYIEFGGNVIAERGMLALTSAI